MDIYIDRAGWYSNRKRWANAPKDFNLTSKVLDLKKVQESPENHSYKSSNRLYKNNGNATFTDVSVKAGILPDLGFAPYPQVGNLNNGVGQILQCQTGTGQGQRVHFATNAFFKGKI